MTAAIRRDLVLAAWLSAFLAVAGAPLGLLAAALTPHVPVQVYQNADAGYPTPLLLQVPEEDRAAFGGDGVVIAVLAVAGLLLALVALRRGRATPAGTVVGLVVGGLAGGAVAMAVHHLVLARAGIPLLSDGATFHVRPYARGTADAAVLPFVAALVWLAGQLRWLARGGDEVSSGTVGSA